MTRNFRSAALVLAFLGTYSCAYSESRRPAFDEASLLSAIANHDSEEVSRVLSLRGARVNFYEPDGYTPLAKAVFRKDERIVQILLEKGADPNIPEGARVRPLGIAIDRAAPDIALMLLENGAKVDSAVIKGRTHPVLALVFWHIHDRTGLHLDVLNQLFAKGMDADVQMDDGMTALEFAVRNRAPKAVDLLVCHGAKEGSAATSSSRLEIEQSQSTNEYRVVYDDGHGKMEELQVRCE